MKKLLSLIALSLFLVLFIKCKEPFEPDVISVPTNNLIVEGFLNGKGLTVIKLSRTHALSSITKLPELGATVIIEDQNNIEHRLSEKAAGEYEANIVPSSSVQYRLKIRTREGKDYQSEYISVLKTPVIDKIGWKLENTGLRVFVNTHDPENKTWYYRWEYEETWIIIPEYQSVLDYKQVDGGYEVIDRASSNAFPLACWQSEKSTMILLGSSKKLDQDIINMAPVSLVPYFSWKLANRYSILVKQYALSAQGFEYWENIRKNTENLGSIFDPQPSTMRGNISCLTDPSELVIGFFDGSNVDEKRIYINHSELQWRHDPGCATMSIKNNIDSLGSVFPGAIPLYYEGNKERVVTAPAYCVDCRLKGTATKPSFWE